MKQLSKAENEQFWSANAEPLKGDAVASIVLDLIGKRRLGRRALDIGAGSGALVRAYRQRRPDATVTGIDLAPRGPDVRKGDCTALDDADASLDTVICTDVIEHLADADLALCLSEMARVLVPGGVLALSTINDEKLEESRVNCPECQCSFHRWGHCQVFTPSRLASLLAPLGIRIEQVITTHLELRAKKPALFGMFYALGLERFFQLPSLTRDLVVIARKG